MALPIRAALAICLAAITVHAAAAEPRCTAAFADGTRINGSLVTWQDGLPARLGDTPLDNPANSFAWLRDESVPLAAAPAALVELWLGDALPGVVTAFRPRGDSPYEAIPGHLIVEPLPDSGVGFEGTARISVRWVRRVVWQRRGVDEYKPGTIFLRDGSRQRFRAARWEAAAVRLLLDDGTRAVPFSQIAELHLPRKNAWDNYAEQVAALLPNDSARLLRLECAGGLIATASASRVQPQPSARPLSPRERGRGEGGSSHPPTNSAAADKYLLVHPAWSLDPLSLSPAAIRQWRSWRPEHVPLSSWEIIPAGRRPVLARGPTYCADRNVQGGPLESGGASYGWGLGVQAPSELEFELPPAALAVRTRIGLDAIAGEGGCARGIIRLKGGPALFESPLLIGSQAVVDAGRCLLPLDSTGGSRTLVLSADWAADQRPPGADPLDVRDTLDWLEPSIELDRGALWQVVHRRAGRLIAAWEGWTMEAQLGGLVVGGSWDQSYPSAPAYRLACMPRERFLKLSRRMRPAPGRDWLLIAASRPDATSSPARLQVQIDDAPVASFNVPDRPPRGDPDPLLVSLAAFHGRDVTIDILQLPSGDGALVDWRAIALVDRPPGILDLFAGRLPEMLAGTPGTADLIAADADRGAALKVTGEQRSAGLSGLPVAIREYPRLGEFRYLRFAWRKAGGGRIGLGLGHDGRFGPDAAMEQDPSRAFRYDAGRGGATQGLALRLREQQPDQWTIETRDLYADFGAFDLTGLSFASPDGAHALYADLRLARTPGDLE